MNNAQFEKIEIEKFPPVPLDFLNFPEFSLISRAQINFPDLPNGRHPDHELTSNIKDVMKVLMKSTLKSVLDSMIRRMEECLAIAGGLQSIIILGKFKL